MKCGTGAVTVLISPKRIMRREKPNPKIESSVTNAQAKTRHVIVRNSALMSLLIDLFSLLHYQSTGRV